MIDSPNYRMADRLAEGRLAERMLSLRADGLSFDRISAELFKAHGIEITGTTVANWLAQIEQECAA